MDATIYQESGTTLHEDRFWIREFNDEPDPVIICAWCSRGVFTDMEDGIDLNTVIRYCMTHATECTTNPEKEAE